MILVARKIDPFKTYTVDELNSMYDLLSGMKSTDIQSEVVRRRCRTGA